MVVAVGLTVTPTPLVAAMLPGVMTPVPFENTLVKVELAPAVSSAGFALKLEIEAAGVDGVELPPHPVRAAEQRRSVMTQKVKRQDRRMDSPE